MSALRCSVIASESKLRQARATNFSSKCFLTRENWWKKEAQYTMACHRGGTKRGGGTPWPPSAPQVLITSFCQPRESSGTSALASSPLGKTAWVKRRESSPLVQLAASEHGHFAEICQTERERRKSWFVYKGFPPTKFCSWLYNLGGWKKGDD